MKEGLCRPDESHWCTECCLVGCPLLDATCDGKTGCLGHNGKRTPDRLTERPLCLELDCLADFDEQDREKIRQTILELAPGQFKMSAVLAQLKAGRRICAWCGKFLGNKLGLGGDSHGMCDDCLAVEEEKYRQSKGGSK